MIRHVRRHFICFTMCILTGAVLLPMIALNVIPALMSYNQNKVILEQAVQNEIRLRTPKPTPQPDNQPSEANPFTVTTAVTTTVEVTTSHSTTTVTETMVAAETAPPESTVLQPQNSSQPQKTGTKPTQTEPSVLTRPSIQTTVKQPQTIPNEPPPRGRTMIRTRKTMSHGKTHRHMKMIFRGSRIRGMLRFPYSHKPLHKRNGTVNLLHQKETVLRITFWQCWIPTET